MADRSNKQKLEILRAAMEIIKEVIDDTDVVVVKTAKRKKRVGTLFLKHEAKVREMHAQGYHNPAIARELGLNGSSVSEWIRNMGLTSNKVSNDSPGYISKSRTLSQTRARSAPPRNLHREQNQDES